MAQSILLIDDSDEIRDLIGMIIESNFDFELVEAQGVETAKKNLNPNSNYSIILCDYNMDDGNGGQVFHYTKEIGLNIPFILLSGADTSQVPEYTEIKNYNTRNGHIAKPFTMESIISFMKTFFAQEGKDAGDKGKLKDYYKIAGKRLFNFLEYKFNLFVKLPAGKYVQIARKDNGFDPEVINNYISKGVRYFYLPGADYIEFITKSLEKLQATLDNPELSVQEKTDIQIISILQIHDCLHELGFSELAIDQAKKVAENAVKTISGVKSLKNVVNNFMKNEDYLSGHSLLISYLGTIFAQENSFNINNLAEKLSVAAFFHDLAIKNNKLAKIDSISSDSYNELAIKDKNLVLLHMEEGAKMLESIPNFSNDTYLAVQNHHEWPDGSGFPKRLDYKKIPLVSTIFIMMHAIADEIVKNALDPSELPRIITKFESVFTQGDFKRVMDCLKKWKEPT